MADDQPIQDNPQDESKKDTVRINLPQGAPGKPLSLSPTPTVRLKPAGAPPQADDESKKETAVMGMPVATPKPKKDTSRVQVPAAKPGVPEMPRPTVKLKREETQPVPVMAPAGTQAPASAPQSVVQPMAPATAAQPAGAAVPANGSVFDTILAVAAMLVAVAVAGYLFNLAK